MEPIEAAEKIARTIQTMVGKQTEFSPELEKKFEEKFSQHDKTNKASITAMVKVIRQYAMEVITWNQIFQRHSPTA